MGILMYFAIVALIIVVIGVLNERFFHIQSDIALVLFSGLISLAVIALRHVPGLEGWMDSFRTANRFDFETYLLDGVLCFMLFAGSSKVSMRKFRKNLKTITLLAFLSTVISSVAYGILFFGASYAFGLGLDIWTCILLGCIVSPTDPIAATGILNKLGMSKNVTSIIEFESLFNDGTGVALFLFVKGIVSHMGGGNFFYIMLTELVGAVAVALVVSFILFQFLKWTVNPILHILISLADVMLVYALCEHLGFSGVIASVVCGMYFAYLRGTIARRLTVQDLSDWYQDFWEVADGILNSLLFVILGLSVMNLQISPWIWVLAPAGIVCVLLSRYIGVRSCTLMVGKRNIPGGYTPKEYSLLMTWSALKGGLSLALVLGTAEILGDAQYLALLNVTYVTIFFTVLVQGLTTKGVYRKIEEMKRLRVKRQRKEG